MDSDEPQLLGDIENERLIEEQLRTDADAQFIEIDDDNQVTTSNRNSIGKYVLKIFIIEMCETNREKKYFF